MRWPGTALVKQSTLVHAVYQSGAGPPHSKEASLASFAHEFWVHFGIEPALAVFRHAPRITKLSQEWQLIGIFRDLKNLAASSAIASIVFAFIFLLADRGTEAFDRRFLFRSTHLVRNLPNETAN